MFRTVRHGTRKSPGRPRRWTVPLGVAAAGLGVVFVVQQCGADLRRFFSENQGCGGAISTSDGDSAMDEGGNDVEDSSDTRQEPDCPLPEHFTLLLGRTRRGEMSYGRYNGGVQFPSDYRFETTVTEGVDGNPATTIMAVTCDNESGRGETRFSFVSLGSNEEERRLSRDDLAMVEP